VAVELRATQAPRAVQVLRAIRAALVSRGQTVQVDHQESLDCRALTANRDNLVGQVLRVCSGQRDPRDRQVPRVIPATLERQDSPGLLV